jgi:hypothetical protein
LAAIGKLSHDVELMLHLAQHAGGAAHRFVIKDGVESFGKDNGNFDKVYCTIEARLHHLKFRVDLIDPTQHCGF